MGGAGAVMFTFISDVIQAWLMRMLHKKICISGHLIDGKMAPVGEKGDRDNISLDQNDEEEEENLW